MYTLDEFIVRLQELRTITGGDVVVMIYKDDIFETAAVEVDKVDPKRNLSEYGEPFYKRGQEQVIISVF